MILLLISYRQIDTNLKDAKQCKQIKFNPPLPPELYIDEKKKYSVLYEVILLFNSLSKQMKLYFTVN